MLNGIDHNAYAYKNEWLPFLIYCPFRGIFFSLFLAQSNLGTFVLRCSGSGHNCSKWRSVWIWWRCCQTRILHYSLFPFGFFCFSFSFNDAYRRHWSLQWHTQRRTLLFFVQLLVNHMLSSVSYNVFFSVFAFVSSFLLFIFKFVFSHFNSANRHSSGWRQKHIKNCWQRMVERERIKS